RPVPSERSARSPPQPRGRGRVPCWGFVLSCIMHDMWHARTRHAASIAVTGGHCQCGSIGEWEDGVDWQTWRQQRMPATEILRGGAAVWPKGAPGLFGDALGPVMHLHDDASEIFYLLA